MKQAIIAVSNGLISHILQPPAVAPRLVLAARVRVVQYTESHSSKVKVVFGRVGEAKGGGGRRPAVVKTCF